MFGASEAPPSRRRRTLEPERTSRRRRGDDARETSRGDDCLSLTVGLIALPALGIYGLLAAAEAAAPGARRALATYALLPAAAAYVVAAATSRLSLDAKSAAPQTPEGPVLSNGYKFWNAHFRYFPMTVVPWAEDAALPADEQYVFGARAPSEIPRRSRGVAADSSSRNIRAAAAASPQTRLLFPRQLRRRQQRSAAAKVSSFQGLSAPAGAPARHPLLAA